MSAPIEWIEAWSQAVEATWPRRKPDGVRFLIGIVRGLPFRAPEQYGIDVRRAWEVFEDVGDTDVGRCAVALAYAIQEDARRS